MKAFLTVEANTLAAANEIAYRRFATFFGGTGPWSMTVLEARPSVQVRNGVGETMAITWSVDYEALS